MVYGPAQLALDNGVPAYWLPNYGPWAGDYQAGAFFHLNHRGPGDALFFLAEWPQSDQAPRTAPNANLHYNIVALSGPLR